MLGHMCALVLIVFLCLIFCVCFCRCRISSGAGRAWSISNCEGFSGWASWKGVCFCAHCQFSPPNCLLEVFFLSQLLSLFSGQSGENTDTRRHMHRHAFKCTQTPCSSCGIHAHGQVCVLIGSLRDSHKHKLVSPEKVSGEKTKWWNRWLQGTRRRRTKRKLSNQPFTSFKLSSSTS